MRRTALRFVPASITRMRCFLGNRGRMKVRPWATADEVLDALDDTLARKGGDEAFWRDLEGLLGALLEDARLRAMGAVGHEVLEPGRLEELIAEIRRALAARERRGFGTLLGSVSAPAAALLLVLAGAVTAGCESERRIEGTPDAAADVEREEATLDPPGDPGCVHDGLTLDEIVRECVAYESEREEIMACLDALNDSWRTGLREYLRCLPCSTVAGNLGSCLLDGYLPHAGMLCENPEDAGEFDLEDFLNGCSVPLYIGVRFE